MSRIKFSVRRFLRMIDGMTWFSIIMIIIIFSTITYFWIRQNKRSEWSKQFLPYVERYATLSDLKKNQGNTYIKGKIIIIDKGNKYIDSLIFQVNKKLFPESPEEVGTVIWLDWGRKKYGFYRDGAKGYMITCKMTVIDLNKNLLVDKRSFFGSAPPSSKKGREDVSGSVPKNKILKCIEEYHRVPADEVLSNRSMDKRAETNISKDLRVKKTEEQTGVLDLDFLLKDEVEPTSMSETISINNINNYIGVEVIFTTVNYEVFTAKVLKVYSHAIIVKRRINGEMMALQLKKSEIKYLSLPKQ